MASEDTKEWCSSAAVEFSEVLDAGLVLEGMVGGVKNVTGGGGCVDRPVVVGGGK
jgi:hypothetical protein